MCDGNRWIGFYHIQYFILSFSKFCNHYITDIITDIVTAITAIITAILIVDGNKSFTLNGGQYTSTNLLESGDLKVFTHKRILYLLITSLTYILRFAIPSLIKSCCKISNFYRQLQYFHQIIVLLSVK